MSASGTETGKTNRCVQTAAESFHLLGSLGRCVPRYRATVSLDCNGSLGSLEHMLGEVSHDA